MAPRICQLKLQRHQAALTALAHVTALLAQQTEALQEHNLIAAQALDAQVELAFGQKERALGALQQHCAEHGC